MDDMIPSDPPPTVQRPTLLARIAQTHPSMVLRAMEKAEEHHRLAEQLSFTEMTLWRCEEHLRQMGALLASKEEGRRECSGCAVARTRLQELERLIREKTGELRELERRAEEKRKELQEVERLQGINGHEAARQRPQVQPRERLKVHQRDQVEKQTEQRTERFLQFCSSSISASSFCCTSSSSASHTLKKRRWTEESC